MKLFSKLLLVIAFMISASCASGYKSINPPLLNYSSHDMQNGLTFSYKYDVLRQKGNKKYAKKEAKKELKLIAVRFENNSDSIINFSRDVIFYSGANPVVLLDPVVIKDELRQAAPVYLLYLLLTPLKLTVTTPTSMDVYPIGFVLGPLVTLENMITAGSANSKLLKELNQYNIINRDILPGEFVYGIIGIHSADYNTLTIRMKQE